MRAAVGAEKITLGWLTVCTLRGCTAIIDTAERVAKSRECNMLFARTYDSFSSQLLRSFFAGAIRPANRARTHTLFPRCVVPFLHFSFGPCYLAEMKNVTYARRDYGEATLQGAYTAPERSAQKEQESQPEKKKHTQIARACCGRKRKMLSACTQPQTHYQWMLTVNIICFPIFHHLYSYFRYMTIRYSVAVAGCLLALRPPPSLPLTIRRM